MQFSDNGFTVGVISVSIYAEEKERLWYSFVCFEEVKVLPGIDFGKVSHLDDEEVCPVKWLLCEITCCRLISLCSIFTVSISPK